MNPLDLKGCRHDVLGFNLKAIGILRALSECAAPDDRDAEAEGWWDLETGQFQLRAAKFPTAEKLVGFFEQSYRPTPIFSPWNKGSGLDEKEDCVFSCQAVDVQPVLR